MRALRWTSLLAALLVPACASRGDPREPVTPFPAGSYHFAGTVGGTQVIGQLVLHQEYSAIHSDLGSCPVGERTRTSAEARYIAQVRRLEAACGDVVLNLEWDETGAMRQPARARVRLEREVVSQGACIRTEIVNRQSVCREWERVRTRVPYWASGSVVIRPEG